MPREDLSQKYNDTVLEIIEERLIPDQEAKKARGEVFTPLRLVNEMLLGVRSSALGRGKIEVWGLNEAGELFDDDEEDRIGGIPIDILRNPNSKILDPASGIGNYPVVAFYILDYQLNKHGKTPEFKGAKNKEKRQKHILKNMLYMIELNKGNVNVCNKIFKLIVPGSSINICCADTEKMTDEKLLEKFNENRFDVVMGNPPFQEEGKSGGKNKLYERITVRGFQLLKDNGHLIFVTPDNIMSGNTGSPYKQIILLNTILISFNNIQRTHFPGIGQSMCYFLVQNSIKIPTFQTIIISQNSYFKVVLKDRSVNPVNEWTKKTEDLISLYTHNEANKAIYYRGLKESNYSERDGKYEVIYTPTKKLYTNDESLAPGRGISKIVLFEYKPSANGYLDVDGNYGVGPHTIYIPFEKKSHAKKLERFFSSPEYKELVRLTTTSGRLKISFIRSIKIDFILQQELAATKIQQAHRTKTNKRRNKGGNQLRKTRKYVLY